jgi:hypothetical protein
MKSSSCGMVTPCVSIGKWTGPTNTNSGAGSPARFPGSTSQALASRPCGALMNYAGEDSWTTCCRRQGRSSHSRTAIGSSSAVSRVIRTFKMFLALSSATAGNVTELFELRPNRRSSKRAAVTSSCAFSVWPLTPMLALLSLLSQAASRIRGIIDLDETIVSCSIPYMTTRDAERVREEARRPPLSLSPHRERGKTLNVRFASHPSTVHPSANRASTESYSTCFSPFNDCSGVPRYTRNSGANE